jgi:tetratricopeptide (TPR) repeat protein
MKLATVCMIKDEEKVIGRMIRSAAPITDIFIFTDTGSTDNTAKEINKVCAEVGVDYELHETTFVDFGVSRTATIKNAEGKADYLLLLDADMTIENKGFNKETLKKDGYQLFYTGPNRYAQMLLVSGKLNWEYREKTHEYIYSEQLKTVGTLDSLMINHHIDGANRKDKFERDVKLLNESIKENPKNKRAWFYLGETYRNMQKPEEAIDAYLKRIELGGWREEVFYSIYQCGRMYMLIKDYDKARTTLMDAWEFRPKRLESLHALGVLLRETKKFNQAVLFLKKALESPFPKDDYLFVEKPIYDYLLRFEYSISLYYVGHKKEALKQCNILLNTKDIPERFYNQIIKNKNLISDDLQRERELKKKNPKFNNKVVFVSMFTPGYKEQAEKLKKSLDDFDLHYTIYEVPNQGTWIRNTQEKPKYIFRALEEYKCPVVWLDADAIVKKKPELFKTIRDDIAFYTIKEWDDMLTGTMFFNYNRRVKEFISNWIYNCEINNLPDQRVFIDLMKKDNTLQKGKLPVEYVKIFDNPHQDCDDPVIIHNQASRGLKDKVNRIDYVRNFDRESREKYNTIAVIGNGPFDDDLSETINSSYVLRCNDFQVGDDFKGIGQKIDMNISSLYPEIIPKAKVDYLILGAHPISSVIGKFSSAKQMFWHWNNSKHELLNSGNEVLTFNEGDEFYDKWVEIAGKIGAFPTTGLMAIALARYWGAKKIVLTGFNFFTTEKTHYWKDEQVRPSAHHKVLSEKELVRQWVEEDNIEYILDTQTKKSLEPASKKSFDRGVRPKDLEKVRELRPDPSGKKTYMFYATKRSGHHAVINWFAKQSPGSVVHYNNLVIDSFIKGHIEPHPPGTHMVNRYSKETPNVFLYNWEDIKTDQHANIIKSPLCEGEIIGPIIIIRDFYNMIASSMANMGVRINSNPDLNVVKEIWKQHAQACINGQDFINYNKWFRDKDYRNFISQKYGISNSDDGLDEILPYAGGSSFDKMKYDGQARKMKVEERYKEYLDNKEFLSLIDDEINELNKNIFNWSLHGVNIK